MRAALAVRLRQLVRDMRYHLASLIEQAARPGALGSLMARLPADGPAPTLERAVLTAIDAELSRQFGAMPFQRNTRQLRHHPAPAPVTPVGYCGKAAMDWPILTPHWLRLTCVE